MRRAATAALLLAGCAGSRAQPATPADRASPLERMAAVVPPGADVVLALDVSELRALAGGVELESLGLSGELVHHMGWMTLAVWDAGTPHARVLTVVLDYSGQLTNQAGLIALDTLVSVSGPPELVAAARSRLRAAAAPSCWDDARFDPAGLALRRGASARLVMAVTPAVAARLRPLFGPEADELAALRLELSLERGLELRAALAARDEGGADALAARLSAARSDLLANPALARLGLDPFVAPLRVDADGARARLAYGLTGRQLGALRERLDLLAEVARTLRARLEAQ